MSEIKPHNHHPCGRVVPTVRWDTFRTKQRAENQIHVAQQLSVKIRAARGEGRLNRSTPRGTTSPHRWVGLCPWSLGASYVWCSREPTFSRRTKKVIKFSTRPHQPGRKKARHNKRVKSLAHNGRLFHAPIQAQPIKTGHCSIDYDRESLPPPANKATVSTGKPKQYYKNAKDLSLSHRLACLATIAAEQLDVLHGPGAVDHLAEHHVLVV